jgi:signal transduction histidine kinase
VADRTRELSALYDVTAIANEFLDLDAVLERSLERVLAAMGAHIGVIYLLDEARETLHVAAQQGVPPDLVTPMEAVAVGSGLAGWVIEHNEPLAVPDVATDPRAFRMVHMGDHHAYVGAPLRVRGQTLGVISVLRESQQPLKVEDVALLTSIADHAGVVIENVRLHRRAEQAAVRVERERLARELHDSVTQSLYSLILFAGAGRDATGSGGLELAAQHLVRIEEIAQQALKEMRLLVYELRPLALERGGLVEALRHRLEAVEGRAGVEAHLLAEQDVELVAPVEETLYYIAQEALNNALKHAAANSVTVRVAVQDGRVTLEVLDDGLGFDPESVRHGGGLGLIGMRERVKEWGGSLQVISAPGEGTRVCVTLGCQEVSR